MSLFNIILIIRFIDKKLCHGLGVECLELDPGQEGGGRERPSDERC